MCYGCKEAGDDMYNIIIALIQAERASLSVTETSKYVGHL